ncbi:SLATT domain-containing protein [Photobacterium swingsii]|uniref:SLATT domain-containing protein n=1 Tax=Photobacterium swingsii TaxID=680026 RepID=UPI003D0B3C9C
MSNLVVNKLIEEAKRIEEDALYSSKGHYNSADKWKSLHYWIGIPAAILAGVASVSAFSENTVIAGYISVLVAILSALSTFLDPNARQNSHKSSGAAFGALKNKSRCFYEIDVHLETDDKKLKKQLDALFQRRDELNSTSLAISAKAYKKAKKDIEAGSNNYKVDINKL